MLGHDEFLLHRPLFTTIGHEYCDSQHPECQELCAGVFSTLIDISPEQVRKCCITKDMPCFQ